MIAHYRGRIYLVSEGQNFNGRLHWTRNGLTTLVPLSVEFEVAKALRMGLSEVRV